MAEFNTRIQLKFDTEQNWETHNPTLKRGEIAVVSTYDAEKNKYRIRLKSGIDDELTSFKDLPYIGKDTFAATDITGLNEFIEKKKIKYQLVQINDDNSNPIGLKLQSAGSDNVWSDVAPSINFTNAVNTLAETASNKVKSTLLGSDTDTATNNTIAGSKKYADKVALDTVKALLSQEVSSSSNKVITGLKIDSKGKLIVTTSKVTDLPDITTALGKKQDNLNFSGTYNASTNKVVLQDTLTSGLAAKQNNLTFHSPYDAVDNQVATMVDVIESVEGLTGAMHYIGTVAIVPAGAEITVNGNTPHKAELGDVVVYDGTGNKKGQEFVYSGKGVWREIGSENSYILKGDAVIIDSYIGKNAISTSKINGLDTEITKIANNSSNISTLDKRLKTTEGTISNQETVLSGATSDLTKIKQGAVSGTGKIVKNIAIDQGKVAATKGNLDIADLVQETTNTIIFNCGTSVL